MMPSGLTPRRLRPLDQGFEVGTVDHRDARIWLARLDRRCTARRRSRPSENGSGWTIFGISVMRTVSVPWLIATLEIRTSWPMTIVPVRSSTTTRAGVSDSTIRFSSSAMKRAAEMPFRLVQDHGARILFAGDPLAETVLRHSR